MRLAIAALLLGLLVVPCIARASPACDALDPPAVTLATAARSPDATDMIELRDIAPGVTSEAQTALAISPDGKRVAFQLRRADVAGNSYCFGIYVLDLVPGARARAVNRGGDYILAPMPIAGKPAEFSSGYQKAVVPRWSPDGRWLAFLRRDNGVTQLWRASPDGSRSAPVSRSSVDIEAFAWTTGGRGIVVSTRPGIVHARAAIADEARSGYHFDERYMAAASNRPFARDVEARPQVETIDVASGASHPATELEQASLLDSGGGPLPIANLLAWRSDGRMAWAASGASTPSARQLWATGPRGWRRRCRAAQCQGRIVRLWWSWTGDALIYLRREGWADSRTALYRWVPGEGPPRRLLVTDALLLGCEAARVGLVCAEESSLRPRHLVMIDLRTGARRPLFDPNPEFQRLALGSVERLRWRNAAGLPTIGDLVLPPDYRGRHRLPLVVVQYTTRGFLRGGTGDEFPIQLFAAAGYAVLSFQRPADIGAASGARDPITFFRANLTGFADRRSVQSALETGIGRLVARGIVDRERIGLTGLSDGATTAQFALLHSQLFAAYAVATCCLEDVSLAYGGKSASDLYLGAGYPRIGAADPTFAQGFFVSRSADRVEAPILVQASDREYLAGLAAVTALQQRGKPVDLYVFPDEYHVKWQPAHRLAIYHRALQWFDFWLRNEEHPNPVDLGQYPRWREWRMAKSAGAAAN